ncbi:FAD-dependent oxidoreductase [Rhizobium sp. AG855]|uniref:FAD/NAD(P)-dependent oxidoreductase n=1 Tax=Rhizobium sp. AG855 TaxID=2183898 RepID=UPI000E731A51|nr:FAD-dependent oxidoreductase [Rhizobium sp. AG855]RKE84660.1 pyruvate/2-oxoglutarate dehydrogenase complex dihydrolipoamide dehydrogenase (E3) component [Rhizobium sp. AG855]
MIRAFDLCVVGGGPAGIAASVMAVRQGLSVVLLDERPNAGGQIYRGLEQGPFRNSAALGADYRQGEDAIARLRAAEVTTCFGASLWRIDMTETGGEVSYSHDGKSQRLAFTDLLLANGAIERPVPFEGWTMPGVMGIGAAQLLLKTSAIVPTGRIALAGNGPLMLLFASQLLRLGVEITAILDTSPGKIGIAAAFAHLPGLLRNLDKVSKGLRLMRDISRAGIPVHRNVSSLSASGHGCVDAVRFEADGAEHHLEVDTLLVHEGIIPNTQLPRALGCAHVWDDGQKCLRPQIDRFGESSISHVYIVGDGAAINGAIAAPASAEIAVGRILQRIGRHDERSLATVRRASTVLARERAFRPFLDALYPPRVSVASPSDQTIICRCEEVSGGKLRSAIQDGAIGPSQAKAFTRCGMGACQGRVCGPIVSQLIATETDRPIGEIGTYTVRFPLKPVTVFDMARCGRDEELTEGHEHAD